MLSRQDDAQHTLVGVGLVLLASIGFSARGVIIKLAYPYGVDAVTLLALRMLFSLPFFVVMGLVSQRGTAPLTRVQWRMVIVLGFIGYYLSSYLSFLALSYIAAALERLLLYLTPTIVLVISAALMKHPIRRHHVAALALTYGGIVLVMSDQLLIATDSGAVLTGSALAFISAFTYAVYLVASGSIIPAIGAARFTAYASGTACGFVIVQFLLVRDLAALDLPLPVYGYGAIMAIFSTVLPLWMMAEGIRRIGANQSSLLSSIGPVATIVLAAILLDEPISIVQICGAALVLGGVWLVGTKRESAAGPARQPSAR